MERHSHSCSIKNIILLVFICIVPFLSFSCFEKSTGTNPVDPSVEFKFCWQYLQWFLIFQDSLPDEPYSFQTPQALYASVNEPYTRYIPPESTDIFLSFLTTVTSGAAGVMIDSVGPGFVIKQVVPGSPAEGAGLQKKDTLLAVNDSSLAGRTLSGAAGLIRGSVGEERSFTVKRGEDIITITLQLGTFNLPTVFTDSLDSAVAYILLTDFLDSTSSPGGAAGEFREALQSTVWAQYTLLDLRGNPGGTINQCVAIAGEFLPKGTGIAVFHERAVGITQSNEYVGLTQDVTYVTDSAGVALEREFIILADKYSASASEILISTLQDQRNFKVVGETTYGKARGQAIFMTPDTGLAKITFATLTPIKGANYDLVGIAPDVSVDSRDALAAAYTLALHSISGTSPKRAAVARITGTVKGVREQMHRSMHGPMAIDWR
jgi:C-terminal peptidase prc